MSRIKLSMTCSFCSAALVFVILLCVCVCVECVAAWKCLSWARTKQLRVINNVLQAIRVLARELMNSAACSQNKMYTYKVYRHTQWHKFVRKNNPIFDFCYLVDNLYIVRTAFGLSMLIIHFKTYMTTRGAYIISTNIYLNFNGIGKGKIMLSNLLQHFRKIVFLVRYCDYLCEKTWNKTNVICDFIKSWMSVITMLIESWILIVFYRELNKIQRVLLLTLWIFLN